ncbi:helix-turn-helix domain-containing protein [Rhizobium sp.]
MSVNDRLLSGAQCRAARALTDVSRVTLAEESGTSEAVIRAFENKIAEPDIDTKSALKRALESLGAIFMPEDEHGGHGVRLKFGAAEAIRIDRLENEGGPVADDDVKD